MALLFADSFNSYADTVDLAKRYANSTPSLITFDATGGPDSDGALRFLGGSSSDNLTFQLWSAASGNTIGGRFKVKTAAAGVTSGVVLYMPYVLSNGNLANAVIQLTTAGALQIGSGSVLGTTTTGISDGAWHTVEFQIFLDDTTGTAKLWLDGALEINFGPGDTVNGTETTNMWGPTSNPAWRLDNWVSTTDHWIKDLAIFDSAGSGNVMRTGLQPYGALKFATLRPSGAGTTTQFTANTGSNYAAVDETAQDGDTTYVQSGTSGHRDLYALANLSESPTTIYGVVLNTLWENPGGGSIQGKQTVKSGSTTSAGSAVDVPLTYRYKSRALDTDPDTSAAWTESAVNALEIGHEVA